MRREWLAIIALGLGASAGAAEPPLASYSDLERPPHDYYGRALKDRLTQVKPALESGAIALEHGSEKVFLASLLKALDIPVSSQMLVFSTTSLQLRLISPSNPRALYFNEDVYLGYVPGGRIEVVSIDPEVGGIFYIFDIPRDARPPGIERSDRCMNCHAAAETQFVPGLLIKSVIPGQRGGSLEAFRQNEIGHHVPLEERLGGWYVTGADAFTNHFGNFIGRFSPDGLAKIRVEPGKTFDFGRYPVETSDLLAQLIHEHQAGFVNLAVEASYRARSYLHADNGQLSAAHAEELDRQARRLTRYLLFANEANLPPGGVSGDPAFKSEFLKNRRAASDGTSLKDFDLRNRLFRHRCSYMIYAAAFQGLPAAMKNRVYDRLVEALDANRRDEEYAYLPAAEKSAIRRILKETLPDLAQRL